MVKFKYCEWYTCFMKWKMILSFVFGFLCCLVFVFVFGSDLEIPFGTGLVVFEESLSAPRDHVSEEDILVLEDEVILKIEGASLSSYVETGSMVPFLDEGANGIRVVPRSESEIDVGDIVSFRAGEVLVVHRVAERGVDSEGIYFVVRGDSNFMEDGKIRFEDILYKTVGVIY